MAAFKIKMARWGGGGGGWPEKKEYVKNAEVARSRM